MINKDRLAEKFGVAIGSMLFLFGIFSFPLAVYATNVIGDIGIIASILAVVALYAIIPFGELVAIGLAVYGLLNLVF